ncbi:MAG: 3-deoxy-manno-octulosonate cytidylyltransferase (CMP-KDO synthetase) [Woeseiaceae bacterium]|jgi:3-deoxy-manno-octulosonate cytidylyltransferase (CMP-KDO synthetase)
MSDFIVVIPARYASARLPGKPLRLIAGQPMIQHVHGIASQSDASEVWIATDDKRIQETAAAFGANVCMTSPHHQSGTDRLAEVCKLQSWSDEQVVVNLQGDEPLLPPVLINECAALLEDESVGVGTLASPLESKEEFQNPNIVKIVTDMKDNALYFSRAQIPFLRDEHADDAVSSLSLQHHGIYAYRHKVLRQLTEAGPCELEQCERLEQLRALWLGITLRVGIASQRPGSGVDNEKDLAAVNAIMEGKG